jgi:osmotically-inducible protein OsmY
MAGTREYGFPRDHPGSGMATIMKSRVAGGERNRRADRYPPASLQGLRRSGSPRKMADQRNDEQHQEDIENDLRDTCGRSRDTGKAENRSDHRDDKESNRPS